MRIPLCRAEHCGGIADDGTGWCAAHRRALTLTVDFQDAVRRFLHGSQPRSAIPPTTVNVEKVTEAGELLAQGLALLVATQFDHVDFVPSAIELSDLAQTTNTPWRVSFTWRASLIEERPVEEKPMEATGEDLALLLYD